MRLVEGFRIPEATDRVIQWPARKSNDPITAIYYPSILGWKIPGFEGVYGDPRKMITTFGNDWYAMYLDRAAEAAK